MKSLLSHQLKENARSSVWSNNIFVKILFGLGIAYMVLNFIVLSLYADRIIAAVFEGQNIVKAFTGLLFYYFSFDIVVRFLMQKLSSLLFSFRKGILFQW